MKEVPNNEIEVMLRRLGRRNRRTASETPMNGYAGEAHLDADELSSYAEGKLPPAARARYTSHLADCADCRSVVAQLAVSIGPVEKELGGGAVQVSAGWREKLASFFAPNVLRYAVPAVVLLVVSVIGVKMYRQSQEKSLVAQNEQRSSANAPLDGQSNSVPLRGILDRSPAKPAAHTSETQRRTENGGAENSEAKKEQSKEGEEAEKKKGETADVVSSTEREKDVKAETKPATSADKAGAAGPPPAAKAAEPAKQPTKSDENSRADDAEMARKQQEQQQQQQQQQQQNAANNAGQRGPSAKMMNSQSIYKGKNAPPEEARGGGGAARARRRAEVNAPERSVEGRRFRREENVWVDSAYEDGRATVIVKRGSEQYRALIADEPAIERIAQQLDGEIVVVWKGRAYRIK